MKKYRQPKLRTFASLVLLSALGQSTGCLFLGDPGHVTPDPDAALSMNGARLELIRHSSSCDSTDSQGLIAEVGPGLEYPAEAVRALKGNCGAALAPGIEVHIEESAVVLDFSNISELGRFPDNEFEGYILEIVPNDDAPFLAMAVLDSQATTLDVIQSDLSVDHDRVSINLANRRFDSESFVKVDLFLLDPLVRGDAEPSDEN